MNLQRILGIFGRKFKLTAYSAVSCLPLHGITRPVFIIGCGRSGTTIFGTSLSKHKDVPYLNEPRHLWYAVYPETDVWTRKARSRNGRLAFTAADAEPKKSKKLSRLFRFESMKRGRPVLIEKLPTNSFRLDFLHRIFPDARFIHIYRSGIEVARSIETISEKGGWYGRTSYKWDKLVEYASNRDDENNLPALCSTYFEKGLLEWRLSTEAVVGFARHLAEEDFFELNYDELIEHPLDTLLRVLKFLGLDDDREVKKFGSEKIVRKTSKLGQRKISDKEKILGGNLLPLSMDGGKGLTNRV